MEQQQSTIDRVREIVTNHQFATIDGAMIDVQTANAIVTVYDNLNATNQQRMASMSIGQMADIAWKLASK